MSPVVAVSLLGSTGRRARRAKHRGDAPGAMSTGLARCANFASGPICRR